MVKRYKKICKKKEIKKLEEGKVNKYTIFLGTFVLIIILMLVVYYSSFIQIIKESEKYQEIQTPITAESEIVIGGFCKRDSECFITYCKGNEKDCVNTTQLTDYHKNCKTYSDWIIENQDFSRCACVQNSCTILK